MTRWFVVGGNSTLARAIIPALSINNTIVTAGRSDCDVYCDVKQEVVVPPNTDVVLICAASFGGVSDESITEALETNVMGVLRVCKAAQAAGVKRIILISSIFTLIDAKSKQFSSYALSKRQGDELAEFYCNLHHLPLTILRPSRIYGDSDAFRKGQPFLYDLIDKVAAGQDIILHGSHDARRNYIHAADLGEIIERIVTHDVTGVYNCTYPEDLTYLQIIAAAQEVYHKDGQVKRMLNRSNIMDDMFPNDRQLYDKIGYRPRINMTEGIARMRSLSEGVKE